jgi:demethylmenaquinone methyltransferase/2-methoxy-6-polyprenyl-1,4-benzoquinol methylase
MLDKKTRFIQDMFSQVPSTYERVNHVLTFGLDTVWRKRAARLAARAGEGNWIDMCTGTGEMAVYLSRLSKSRTRIYTLDMSPDMLEVARQKPECENVRFVVGDTKFLPFPDHSFDLITMGFATRNLNLSKELLTQSFSEYCRILKPGGRFVNLETSQPSFSLFRKIVHFYIKLSVKSIGSRISGSRAAYAYLATTIPRFYPPQELAAILQTAGFGEVTYRRQLFGVAAIHEAIK